MKKIICYTSGGLCNRILPLLSLIKLNDVIDSELYLYWPVDRICGVKFDDIFEYKIKLIEVDFLESLSEKDTFYYCKYPESITNEINLYQRNFFKKIIGLKLIAHGDEQSILNTNKNNILIFSPTQLKFIDNFDFKFKFEQLKIKKDIISKANEIGENLQLNKNIIGAHLRGADFNKPFSIYLNQITKEIEQNKQCKIFISSGEKEIEERISQIYPHNIIRRNNKNFIKKYNENLPWENNVVMNSNQVIDGLIDILLLSKTNFKIYDDTSTFAQCIKLIS